MSGAQTHDPCARLWEALDRHDCQPRGNPHNGTARCPAHDDRNASLSLGVGRNGAALVNCHAGCKLEDVLDAIGLEVRHLFADDRAKPWSNAGLRATGASVERDGRIRLGGVRYLPGAPDGQPKALAAKGAERDLWPDPASVTGDVLYVVEGEPDAVTGASIGLPTVGVPGAAKWSAEFAARLAEARRRVVVIADSDEPGRAAAQRTAEAIAAHCVDVRLLDLAPERDDGFDLSDFAADAQNDQERAQAARLLAEAAETATRVSDPHGSTWRPVTLEPVIDAVRCGASIGPQPSLMRRPDGVALLYPGQVHSFAAEPESGKSWLVLAESARLINDERAVLYLDFEDTSESIVGRLLALGARPEAIGRWFTLVRPDDGIKGDEVARLLQQGPFALAVVDGVTEAMGLLGLEVNSNDDVARFRKMLARPLARSGAATVEVDHVAKDPANRGRFALGGGHKLAGVAVAYGLTAIERPSRVKAGRIKVTVEKDRHGHVRAHQDAGKVIAIARIEPEDDGRQVTVTLDAPDSVAADGTFRPTVLMERVSRAIEDDSGMSRREVLDVVKGKKREAKIEALDLLVAEGFVRVEADGRAQRHFSERPFRESDDVPGTFPDVPEERCVINVPRSPVLKGERGTGTPAGNTIGPPDGCDVPGRDVPGWEQAA